MNLFFNSKNIRTEVDDIKITGVTRPALMPKKKSLVDVPGRDYPWDFGDNKKETFEIMVDVAIEAAREPGEEEKTLIEKINQLLTFLDYDESKELYFSDDSANKYQGQVYDGVQMVESPARTLATGTIVFECYEV